MYRKIKFIPEKYYHIYNRGADKREVFLNEADYLRFITLLYVCNNTKPIHIKELIAKNHSLENVFNMERMKTLVSIGAYCLMPNHFHLLIKENADNGISMFMKKLCTAYAMYFNKKNERSGILFQGRFKAEIADTDEYLKYLFAYIHLNPVKSIEPGWKENGIKNEGRIIKFLNNYQWSSYGFYIGGKQKDPILNIKEFPNYFEGFKEFKVFIVEWLNYKNFLKPETPEDRPREKQ